MIWIVHLLGVQIRKSYTIRDYLDYRRRIKEFPRSDENVIKIAKLLLTGKRRSTMIITSRRENGLSGNSPQKSSRNRNVTAE